MISEDAFDQKELTLVTSPNGIVEQLAEEKGFSCELLDKAVRSIEIAKFPAKLTYSMGEELDETGMELAVTYEDGSGEIITAGWSSVGYAENIGKTAIHVILWRTKGRL